MGTIDSNFTSCFFINNEKLILATASGLSETKEIAQRQISVGMGLLAGSGILLTSLVWGSCVVIGKWDIDEGTTVTKNRQNKKGFSLTGM